MPEKWWLKFNLSDLKFRRKTFIIYSRLNWKVNVISRLIFSLNPTSPPKSPSLQASDELLLRLIQKDLLQTEISKIYIRAMHSYPLHSFVLFTLWVRLACESTPKDKSSSLSSDQTISAADITHVGVKPSIKLL